MSTQATKKRKADPDASSSSTSTKAQKNATGSKPDASSESSFRWLKPLGPKKTCLYGVNLTPKTYPKVAMFDLDGTIIVSAYGKGQPKKNRHASFTWWHKGVVKKLEEVHNSGYSVVIISNQKLSKDLEEWKIKIHLIAASLPNVPFRIFAASADDEYRKPMLGMLRALKDIHTSENVEMDTTEAYFVGDAAGRPDDHSGTDRKWAINAGVKFYTPEEFFLGQPASGYQFLGYDTTSLIPDEEPFTPALSTELELVLLVGYPSMGKSRLYRKHFGPAGYVHINQDLLGTRKKCKDATEEALATGKSCVIDNTNRDGKTRKEYIDIAKKFGVPVRCFRFENSIDLAWHNNMYRTHCLAPSTLENEVKRNKVPNITYFGFQKNYEEPALAEGFSEIVEVRWCFEGSEEERSRWSVLHQSINGK
ncbi:polynucleotide kinase 3 phosphatase-domain-containing protein [Thelephora terrestris]|uniref:Polynucleotide kinase 3 phosphatase-domain-containing protein n=1 Tax=Thelephora terrestris TaxID=56493 RepID=A0A9P6LAX1_9AGAM|nr:polynucleotide kinase 3 phosphatase-domain-containing protein [Thelephora terrestris]